MIPEGFATFLTFLGLVAPGLVYQLVLERRQPRRGETTFREASRIALTSLAFTVTSLLALAIAQRFFAPARWLVDIPALIEGRWTYVGKNVLVVVSNLALL